MAEFYGVLADNETGDKFHFSDRSEYLATLYGGGMSEVELPSSPPSRELPDPRPRREPADPA